MDTVYYTTLVCGVTISRPTTSPLKPLTEMAMTRDYPPSLLFPSFSTRKQFFKAFNQRSGRIIKTEITDIFW